MSKYFTKTRPLGGNMKAELDYLIMQQKQI